MKYLSFKCFEEFIRSTLYKHKLPKFIFKVLRFIVMCCDKKPFLVFLNVIRMMIVTAKVAIHIKMVRFAFV